MGVNAAREAHEVLYVVRKSINMQWMKKVTFSLCLEPVSAPRQPGTAAPLP